MRNPFAQTEDLDMQDLRVSHHAVMLPISTLLQCQHLGFRVTHLGVNKEWLHA